MKQIFTLLFVLLSTAACSSEDEIVAAPDYFAESATCLSVADYECARTALSKADEGPDRTAGETFINLLEWLKSEGNTLVELAELIAGQTDSAPWYMQANDLKGTALLNRLAYGILEPGWQRLQEQRNAMAAVLDDPRGFSLPMTNVPVLIGNVPAFVYRGVLTEADFALLTSALDLAAIGMSMLLSADLDFPVGPTVRFSKSLKKCSGNDQYSRRRCWSQVSAFAIHNADNLLGLEPSRGTHFQKIARDSTQSFYDNLKFFLERVQVRGTDAPADSALIWQGRPAGGGWITWKFGSVPLTPDQVNGILQGTETLTLPYKIVEEEVQLTVQPTAITGLTDIVEHLSGRRPEPVSVNQSVLPPLLTGLEFAMQSDAAMTLIQLMAEGVDEGLAADLREFVVDLRKLYSDYSNADALQRLFEYLLPASMTLDLDTFYTSPQFLRLFLPETITASTFEDYDTFEWQFEWECNAERVDVLQCEESAPLVDAPHFVGTAVSMPADGIMTREPYVGYLDPSFGQVLAFDPWEVDAKYPSGVTHPNLEQLHRLFQETGRELQNRLQ